MSRRGWVGISLREHKGSENKRFGQQGRNVHILPTDIVLPPLSENMAAQLAQFLGMVEFKQIGQIYVDSRSCQ